MKVLCFLMVVASLSEMTLSAPQQGQGYDYQAPQAAPSYNFGYDVNAYDPLRRPVLFGHKEGREGPSTQGTYYVLLPDQRLMTVSYVADATGFHPRYSFRYVGGQAARATPGRTYNTPAAAVAPTGGQAALSTPGQVYNTPAVGGQAALSTPGQVYNTPVGK